MKDLKQIWDSTNFFHLKNKEIIETENPKYIFLKLEKEENRRKKYFLSITIFILIIMMFFSWLVYYTEGVFGINQIIGVGLITIGSVFMVYFIQLVKIPFDKFKYQETSLEFLKVVKAKLVVRKKFLIGGISVQFVLLTVGLHFIIFSNSLIGNGSKLGLHYGSLFAFSGFAIGLTVIFYNAHYKPILKKIEAFLKE